MKDRVTLTTREQKRLLVLNRMEREEMTAVEAAGGGISAAGALACITLLGRKGRVPWPWQSRARIGACHAGGGARAGAGRGDRDLRGHKRPAPARLIGGARGTRVDVTVSKSLPYVSSSPRPATRRPASKVQEPVVPRAPSSGHGNVTQ